MADAPAANANSAAAGTVSPRASRGGGRGRGRGRAFVPLNSESGDAAPRSNDNHGGRRGRGGNRGGSSAANTMNAADLAAKFANATPAQASNKSAAPTPVSGESGKEATEDDDDAEVCFICASPVVHHSVAPCNHRTCHICALRMRALYKTKDCAHCRTEAPYVIFTDDATKRFQDFTNADLVSTDENIGIKYENTEIVEDTLLLLRYNCPDPSCDVACLGWPDLHRHVRSTHHKKMCDLCTRNKKVFTHEHEVFTDKELERHMKKGDDNPGAVDQSGFKGHPLCGFCGQRFYGDDELYVHCRAKHERCFICDRREGRQPQYYLNYDSLEQHFKVDHFLCSERDCLDKKFIVFPSELDLKAHQLQEHGNTLSKDVRRDARMVDISSFDYRAPYQQERRGGASSQREGRGRGRGRDPNAEPLPPSSAQPLRRDEQAFQRQMAIHSAQSVSTRTFGGQLTAAPPAATRGPAASREPQTATVTAPRPSGNVDSVAAQLNAVDLQDPNISSQEQARRLRHAAVVERATALLQNDPLKLSQFRNAISSFRSNSVTAAALIDTFFALFSDTSSNALGSLIREIADLYEDKAKAESLRTAWNDWRAINEDYPSLPGPSGLSSGSLPLGWAQVTASTPSSSQAAPPKSTSRVLKLKSSTAQSSRSEASRHGSWGSTNAPAGNPFPGLPSAAASASTANFMRAGPTPRMSSSATPWLNSASASANPPRATPPSSRPASRGPQRNVLGGAGGASGDMFPSLPPAAKPTSTIFGYGTGMVRRDAGGSNINSNAWGSGSGGNSADVSAQASESEGQGGQKRKGNKGKKQVLVQWG